MINAYSIVLLPEYNCFPNADLQFFREPPGINGILYAGYSRKPFLEIENKYLENSLPEDISILYKKVLANDDIQPYSYSAINSYEDVMLLKEYTDSLGSPCEVIGMGSPEFFNIYGLTTDTVDKEFLGYDFNMVLDSGVLTCVFEKGRYFNKAVNQINKYGLFNSVKLIEETVAIYLELQETGEDLEEISAETIDVVEVYRLK